MPTDEAEGALRLVLDVWHPGCWVREVTEQSDVGLLGYGIYTRDDGRATTHEMIYGDTRATIEQALDLIRAHPAVYSVSEMTHGYHQPDTAHPGNATRDILLEHDGTTQISDAFTSRGFTYAEPAETYSDRERWTLLSNDDRGTIQSYLDEIRVQEAADITIESIAPANQSVRSDSLPINGLSHRQREVFQLARKRGYYRQPTETTAGELAAELDITTSTFHEHLHKAEEKHLDLS